MPNMTSSSRFATRRRLGLLLLSAIAALFCGALADAQNLPADAGMRQYEELVKIYREGRHDAGEREKIDEEAEEVEAREAWLHYRRSFPYGTIPAGARVDAIRATEALERSLERSMKNNGRSGSLLSLSLWESIGPTNQGGRIKAIAIHPTKAGVFLVGAAAGGVWKTTDGGGTWRPTFDNQSAIAIGALAFDQTNPDIVYAGTGEDYNSVQTLLINTPSYLGGGIFKSTDEGETWTGVGLESVGAFSKVAVHRQKSSIVYATGSKQNGGFYRSTDGGATWKRTIGSDLRDMSVNPQNGDEVYVATAGGVQRSTDAGETFVGATAGMNSGAGARFSVAVAPSLPSQVYALGARGPRDAQVAEIYKSSDRGASWRLMRTFDVSFFNGQGDYDNFVSVHPTNPNVVLIGGVDVFRTSNGGDSWTNVTRAYSGGNVHADQHIAHFDPVNPDAVVLGNDGGVYISIDAGLSWDHQSSGLAVTQFYRMEVDQTRPFRVYGGTQDNGTSGSFGTTGFTGNWRSVLGGDGFFVQEDLSDPNWFYAEYYFGALFRINANDPNQASRVDWSIPSTGADGDEGNWATPIAMSPVDRVSLYSGRTNLWRTTNRGGRWTKIPVGISSKLSAIGLSPIDARYLVVGSVTGQVRYSTDNGATWGAGAGLPTAVVNDIRFDPVRPERVYAVYSGFASARVFRSDSYGAQWTDITANLPKIPVNAIAIDPVDPARLFVATDIGVFFSPSGGDFWIPFNAGLPRAPVSDLRIHRASRSLVAATHGRSMFRVGIDAFEIEPALVQPVGGERISTPGPLEVRWIGFSGPVNVSIRYSADEPFQIVAAGVADSRVTLTLPMRLSSTARVRVEEIGSGRTVTSGPITLVTPSNATSLGKRAFIAEAIELRGSTLWATSRASDTIHRLRLPLLTGSSPIVRSGFTGPIRDLAYDPSADEFFALVTDADLSRPRIYRMDTNGRSLGELALPSELMSAAGIAIRGDALAVSTGGSAPELWQLDAATGALRERSAIEDAGAAERRGLVWNGREFVQMAMRDSTAGGFDAELQQIAGSTPTRIIDRVPVVVATGGELRFFGLAHDPGASGVEYYFATDTSGAFYRFRADILGAVDGEIATGGPSAISMASIQPNPAQHEASLDLRAERALDLRVIIVDAGGSTVASVLEGRTEAGPHRLALPVAELPSGVYYVVVEAGGDRVVRALTVLR
jgi:photosystem II stability/assembly factor-like uncharacterized protein